ncbi:MAG: Holliday junction resolvase RuvX [Candidatus Symbiobacter sp.]|nr:Holliday junction resolvase RuvX [Candidatus Symbiobacter sp.]
MPIIDKTDWKNAVEKNRPILGLDVGSKTIGLAIADRSHLIASALMTIRRGKFAADAAILAKIIAERDVCALVIGYPIEMSGTVGKRCQSVRQFARNLGEFISLPMFFQDERLSTQAAEKIMIAADLSRARRAAIIDQSAATYILQNALDAAFTRPILPHIAT